ncbi:hypothetical protein AB4099_34305 [Bosea sp. 2KB_26]
MAVVQVEISDALDASPIGIFTLASYDAPAITVAAWPSQIS